jgi:hypothetical protein
MLEDELRPLFPHYLPLFLGSRAYAIRLLPGFDDSVIDRYEAIHRLALFETYRSVLRRLNGA